MACSTDIFHSPENENWFKCCMAMNIAREFLAVIVDEHLKTLHEIILQDVKTDNNLPTKNSCGVCTIHTVLKCPTSSICTKRGGCCKYHDSPGKQPKACPSNMCGSICRRIENEHRFSSPSWRNTETQGWYTSPWEVGKCFMPTDGYKDKQSANETDFNGLISIVINCKWFQQIFEDDLSKSDNNCVKARDIGRTLRHSSDIRLTKPTMLQYLDCFINLLNDKKHLQNHMKSTESRDKIAQKKIENRNHKHVDMLQKSRVQLRTEPLENSKVTTDDALKGAVSMIEELKKLKGETLNSLNEGKIKYLQDMKDELATALSNIAAKGKRVQETLESQRKQIQTNDFFVPTHLRMYDESGKQGKVDTSTPGSYQLNYNRLKQELRSDLSGVYTKLSLAPVSPLIPDIEHQLRLYYFNPNLRYYPSSESGNTYSRLLYRNQKRLCNIYLQGERGSGKTAFCSNLAIRWCIQHNVGESRNSQFSRCGDMFPDNDVLKQFDFLFFISLQAASRYDGDVESMIYNQIICKLPEGQKYRKEFVTFVLKNEHCLILLDGLDQWIHPENKLNSHQKGQKCKYIPDKKMWKTCTILTTTRSWKMKEVIEQSLLVDRLIEIRGVEDSNLMINIVNECIANSYRKDVRALNNTFRASIHPRDVAMLAYTPTLCVQFACLVFLDINIGRSKCNTYSSLIDLSLTRATAGQASTQSIENVHPSQDRISCFKNKACYRRYKPILERLGCLAFFSLCASDRESTVIFDESFVTSYLNCEILNIALKSFILVRHERSRNIPPGYSFLHHALQEFLAAYHLSTKTTHLDSNMTQIYKPYETIDWVLDIGRIFVFVCGMNAKVAELLSASITTKLNQLYKERPCISIDHIRDLKLQAFNLQNTFTEGLYESRVNTVERLDLACTNFVIGPELQFENHLKRLIDTNAGEIITFYGEMIILNGKWLEKIINDSRRTITNLILHSVYSDTEGHAVLDLHTCQQIKVLDITEISGFSFIVDTSNLIYCRIHDMSDTMLHSLAAGAKKLQTLIVDLCTDTYLLCQILPSLSKLIYFQINDVDLNTIEIPNSTKCIHLENVTFLGNSLKELFTKAIESNHAIDMKFINCKSERKDTIELTTTLKKKYHSYVVRVDECRGYLHLRFNDY